MKAFSLVSLVEIRGLAVPDSRRSESQPVRAWLYILDNDLSKAPFCSCSQNSVIWVQPKQQEFLSMLSFFPRPLLWASLLLLGIMVLPCQRACAQDDDISQYLDDDNISEKRNIVLLNSTVVFTGDLPIHIERAFFRRIGLEVAAGLILPHYLFELPFSADRDELQDLRMGYSLWLHPKYYFRPYAPEYNYIGPQYRRRQYNLAAGGGIIFHDFSINYGFNLFLRKHFIFSYNVGIGYRMRSDIDAAGVKSKMELAGLAVPWNVRFGFVF